MFPRTGLEAKLRPTCPGGGNLHEVADVKHDPLQAGKENTEASLGVNRAVRNRSHECIADRA